MTTELLVANSYTGELFPVDKTVVSNVIEYAKNGSYWSDRMQTIYDLLMAGF